jgi:hypothetical protein
MGIILGGHIFKNFSFLNCLLAGLEGRKEASKQGTNSLEESILFEEDALRVFPLVMAKLGLLVHI